MAKATGKKSGISKVSQKWLLWLCVCN